MVLRTNFLKNEVFKKHENFLLPFSYITFWYNSPRYESTKTTQMLRLVLQLNNKTHLESYTEKSKEYIQSILYSYAITEQDRRYMYKYESFIHDKSKKVFTFSHNETIEVHQSSIVLILDYSDYRIPIIESKIFINLMLKYCINLKDESKIY